MKLNDVIKDKKNENMYETDYRQDYIVTWSSGSEEVHEGFQEKNLTRWEGETDIERIQECFRSFNESAPLEERRYILKIEKIGREVIYELEKPEEDGA